MKTISVRGTGRASRLPDCVELSFTVRRVNADCAAAATEVNERAQALTAEYNKLFPDALRTTAYDVSVEYANVNENGVMRQKQVGYACRQNFRLSIVYTKERLSAALAVLRDTEAELSLRFTVKDIEALRGQALAAACRDAEEKARIIADSCGCRLGQIVAVRYGTPEAFPAAPLRMNDRAVAAFASAGAEIAADEVRAEDCVEIERELL